MSSAHDLPPAIQWHEGMLLSPQHFQQLVLRGDRLWQYHLGLGLPYHFGVSRLRYESTQLFSGTLRITELEAVLPDSLVIAFRSGPDGDLQVDLRPHMETAKHTPVMIYLAVPAERTGGSKGDGVEEDVWAGVHESIHMHKDTTIDRNIGAITDDMGT